MRMIDLKRTWGASTEAVREVKRGIVLNLIRTRQPISRADLARLSGLQRSTISLIVEQLVEERWVAEGPMGVGLALRRPEFPGSKSLADQGDTRAITALETMAHYLGRGMRMIVAGLAPEQIIVVGDLTRSWHRFGPVIESEVQAQVLPGGDTSRPHPRVPKSRDAAG